MKILYIALKYDYGKAERGLSFEHYNFYDSLKKMDGRAHEIIYFPFDEVIKKEGIERMNEILSDAARQAKPDMCFFFLFSDAIKMETVAKITKSGFLTFNWFSDDHFNFDNYSKHYANAFSWIGTTDSMAPEKYRKIGYFNVIKTQWAFNHFFYKPSEAKNEYGITFVGQPHGNRKKIVNEISKKGILVDCYGQGWKNGRVSQEEMINIFSKSKINLNLTKSSQNFLLKSIAKIFVRKSYDGTFFLNSLFSLIDNMKFMAGKKREQIKARNFEIPGCKGFLLTSDADNLKEYYENGKEIVIFKGVEDLIDKINYYLNHDNEREIIRRAGYERTLKDHTYEKRFKEIFKIMGLIK